MKLFQRKPGIFWSNPKVIPGDDSQVHMNICGSHFLSYRLKDCNPQEVNVFLTHLLIISVY